MQSYYGHVRTQQDAILLFEACRQGLIPRICRRLSERERYQISSGCVYIWDEQEAGMRRWTDGKSWSASRVSGAFLTYREMEGSRRGSSPDAKDVPGATSPSSRSSPGSPSASKKRTKFWDDEVAMSNSSNSGSASPSATAMADSGTIGPGQEGYRYKPNGLYKQSFSITTMSNLKLHLISYYRKEDIIAGRLVQPTNDPRIKDTPIPLDLYPDSSPGVSLVPATTTTPLLVHDHYSTASSTPSAPSSVGGVSPSMSVQMPYSYPPPSMTPPLAAAPVPHRADGRHYQLQPVMPSGPVHSSPAMPPPITPSASPPNGTLRTEGHFSEDKRVLGILDKALVI